MIIFPATSESPYTDENGTVWTWNGSAWSRISSGGVASTVPSPDWTPIEVLDQLEPTGLTMRPVHSERSRDPLPSSGPHVPLVEQFLNVDRFNNRYQAFLQDGTSAPASEGIDRGIIGVVAGASGTNRTFRAQTKLASPTGVFAALRVEPTWTYTSGGGTYACVGFGQLGAGTDFVQAVWRLDTGALTINTGGGAGQISGNASAGTIPGPTAATGPMWIGLILGWPVATLVTSRDGENWNIQTTSLLTRTNSLLLPAEWDQFRPIFRLAPLLSGDEAQASSFRAGYVGNYGHLNHRMVTLVDGTPFRRDGKYFMTITVPHSNASWLGQHCAVLSFDPVTYATELVSHLLVDWDNKIGSASVAAICYDPDTALWHMFASTWGISDKPLGIDLIYGTTTKDLLSPSVSIVKCETITIGANSMYDAAPRKLADGTWAVAVIETTSRINWSGNQARLLTGATPQTLAITASDSTDPVDGTHWAKIGGDWYILAGGASGFLQWSDALTNKTALPTWSANMPSGLVDFGGFMAHPSPMVVDDGWRTRYLSFAYDGSRFSSLNGTKGGMLVQEADQKPPGQEFRPALIPRYEGV